jgi:hypothetical protein
MLESANILTIAIDSRGFWLLLCGLQKYLEEIRRRRVVMLPITEKLLQILLQKPVEIANPVQPLRMNDHTEPGIAQEGAAKSSGFSIPAINRDDHFEISECLSLQAFKAIGDEIDPFIDWHSHRNARNRQAEPLQI